VPPATDRQVTAPASSGAARGLSGAVPWLALGFCGLFFLQGLALIPYLGLQIDESLFGMGLYPPITAERGVRLFGHVVPTMIMSYIGALKMWMYALVFSVWPPSPYSVRVPVAIMGAATIWLFFLLLRRRCGERTALAGCALLAFDTTFLMTTTFDWGPVALQHLLLVGAAFLIIRFYESGSALWLGGGFFLLGLGLWDKALFIWMLGGLGAATLVVFPRELFSRLNWRTAAVAIVCFLAGAAPLLHYNKATRMRTFASNVQYSASGIEGKLYVARAALEGNSLLGYMVREEPAPRPGQPSSFLEAASVKVSHWTDEPRTSLMAIAFVLTLALLPWLWSTPARKPIVFSLVFIAVTWAQMALNQNTGGGTHHVVLLWPFPHLAVAAAFTQATLVLRRFSAAGLAVLVGLTCGSSALVTNQHLAQLVERGSGTVWTDAVYPLADYLKQLAPTRIYVVDWGMFDSLRLLDEGRLHLFVGSGPFSNESMSDADRREAAGMLADRDAVFLNHTAGNEQFPGVTARLQAMAAAAGYEKQTLKIIPDRMGRPIFEVYRWEQKPAAPVTAAPAPHS